MKPAISVRNLSKCYKLGVINRKTLVDEVRYWLSKARGRDPREHFTKIGHTATEARRVEAENTGDDRFWALKDVSFDVQPGEVVGIIGRNGAGKSTLLKILTRITEPTSGEAFINGRVGSLLEVGTGFHPELTGRENIYMNGTILGMKKQEVDTKFDEIVAFSEIEKFIDTPVKRYSSGMYVRLAFAVAAHLEPEILVVDEVLSVGDAEFQKKCLGKMENIAREGRTVLFVSHNMAAVRSIAERGVLIKNGCVFFIGTIDEAVTRYLEKDQTEDHNGYYKICNMHRMNIRKDLSKKILFRSIELRNGRDELSRTFEEQEIIKIISTVESLINTNFLEILFRISTSEDIIVSTITTGLMNIEVKKGIYEITCSLHLQNLIQGKYKILAYLLSSNRNSQDLIIDLITFDIINNKSSEYSLREKDVTKNDIVTLPRKWTIPKFLRSS